MSYLKDGAVALAVGSLLISAGLAKAESPAPKLSLDSSVVTLDDAGSEGLLMQGLDKVGAGKTLKDMGINVYGWVEAGYTANLRNNSDMSSRPGPFTTEPGNHAMLNQVDLRIERMVDPSKGKFDVGGMVEFVEGTDSNWDQMNGMEIQTNGSKGLGADDNTGEIPILDITQAYVDVAVPIGSGLKVRAGRFVTLLSYETIAPGNNPFYSHSYLFGFVPFTQTGVLGFYNLNDQWRVVGGVTRGWDQGTEDNNGGVDFLGQVAWTPSKAMQLVVNLSVGPQNANAAALGFTDAPARYATDNAHYRTTIDPVLTYQVNDKLKVAAEALYTYDGGYNATGGVNGTPRSYGDVWGAAGYISYALNDMFTLNGRLEGVHPYTNGSTTNVFEVTAGVTITPLPKDEIGKNLKLRPEIRYDYAEDPIFSAGNRTFKDNWTAGADVIFTF